MGRLGDTEGDYWLLFFKLFIGAIVIVVLGLFVVRPWLLPEGEVIYKCEKTAKMMAQERLLAELRDCENKFDYDSTNIQYCDNVMKVVVSLIESGHFEDNAETVQALNETSQKLNTQADTVKYKDAMDNVREHVNSIIGDI